MTLKNWCCETRENVTCEVCCSHDFLHAGPNRDDTVLNGILQLAAGGGAAPVAIAAGEFSHGGPPPGSSLQISNEGQPFFSSPTIFILLPLLGVVSWNFGGVCATLQVYPGRCFESDIQEPLPAHHRCLQVVSPCIV